VARLARDFYRALDGGDGQSSPRVSNAADNRAHATASSSDSSNTSRGLVLRGLCPSPHRHVRKVPGRWGRDRADRLLCSCRGRVRASVGDVPSCGPGDASPSDRRRRRLLWPRLIFGPGRELVGQRQRRGRRDPVELGPDRAVALLRGAGRSSSRLPHWSSLNPESAAALLTPTGTAATANGPDGSLAAAPANWIGWPSKPSARAGVRRVRPVVRQGRQW
jgi:hypothetical protein